MASGGGQAAETEKPSLHRRLHREVASSRLDGALKHSAARALTVTREAWRRAYLGEPATPGELGAMTLAAVLADEAADATETSAFVVAKSSS